VTDIDAMIGEIEKYAIDEDRAYTNSRYNNYAIVILCSELRRAREALKRIEAGRFLDADNIAREALEERM